jgi:hypothetical protein
MGKFPQQASSVHFVKLRGGDVPLSQELVDCVSAALPVPIVVERDETATNNAVVE